MSESQTVEWKTSWRDEYLKWICGFANAQGGALEIGRNDRGEVVGVKDVLRLLEEIPNKAQALLGITVDVNLKSESGREYLEIVVDPYPNPISYKGEFHYRSGSTKQTLKGTALNHFLLQKYGRTWDDVPMPGIGLGDLDGRTLEEFCRRAAESGRLPREILYESAAGMIEKLRLREGEYLKRAATLLFHPSPGRFVRDAYIKIGAFRGPELLYQDVVEGNLFSQVEQTMDLLYSKYSMALISYDGIYRVETFPVPREAMREAVINAVIHREYAVAAPIQIRVYDDRLLLWNPGQLPPDWSMEQLTGEHSSRPGNPGIAYAFFRAGMVEAWGRGIRLITKACEAAGNPPPKWKIEPGGGLWLEFPYSATYRVAASRTEPTGVGESGGANRKIIGAGRKTSREPAENQQRTGRKPAENRQETSREPAENQQRTGRKPAENQQRTSREPAENQQRTGRKPAENQQRTSREPAENQQRTGRKPAENRQETSREPAENQQRTGRKPAENQQRTSRELAGNQQRTGRKLAENRQETSRERILALLEAQPEITIPALAKQLGLSVGGVRYHLDRLKAAGHIRHVGPTKAGRWEALK